jgi:hypothetical protein
MFACEQDDSHVEGWNEKLASGMSRSCSTCGGTAYACCARCIVQILIDN